MSSSKRVSMEDAFQIFTITELKYMCKKVGLTGISYLRKNELIQKLIETLTDPFTFCQYFLFATPQEMKAFRKAFEHPVIKEEKYDDYVYFLSLGYCFIDEDDRVFILKEIEELYQDLDEGFWRKHKKYHQLINYMNAAVHFYGVIELPKFVEFYEKWTGVSTTNIEIKQLDKMCNERREICDFDIEEDLLIDEILLDEQSGYFAYEGVYEQQKSVSYYIPDREELIKYIDEEYIEKTKEYEIFLDYLVSVYQQPKYFAEDECESIIHSLRLGYAMEDVLKKLEELGIIMDQFRSEDLYHLLLELINHTRTMFLRGHTPLEVGTGLCIPKEKKRLSRFVYQGRHEVDEKNGIVIQFPGNHF